MWWPVHRPDGMAIVNVLLPHFPDFVFCNVKVCDQMQPVRRPTSCPCNGGVQAHIHGKKNQTAWMHGSASSYCRPQREHMRSVLAWFRQSCWFCMFQLVQEGTTVLGLATSHPDSVAESFLNIGDAIVRRQYTHAHEAVWNKSSILVTCCQALCRGVCS